jgi:pimeloyl-ACP methyl ester carboxylesterase
VPFRSEKRSRLRRIGAGARSLRAAAAVLCSIAAVVAACPLVALGAVAETAEGRSLAFGLLAALLSPALLLAGGWRRARTAAACGAVAAALLGLVAVRAPDGRGEPGSGLSSGFAGGGALRRWSPANLLPELDQIKLSTSSGRQLVERLLGDAFPLCLTYTLPMQREMYARSEFRALGSAMHDGYADLAGVPVTGQHWWRYVPPDAGGRRLPVVVFFHGFGANFKSYLWVWKRFADRARVAVLLPTSGFGLPPEGPVGLEPFLEAWRRDPALDWSRAWVAGLSNGALRAARSAAERPGAWRGVMLISPIAPAVWETGSRVWRGNAEIDGSRYPPVLALYGSDDGGVTDDLVAEHEARLRARGLALTRRCYRGLDHFLIYGLQAGVRSPDGSLSDERPTGSWRQGLSWRKASARRRAFAPSRPPESRSTTFSHSWRACSNLLRRKYALPR